jgi:tetratricopeptide (TPR) repeat protein
MSEVYIVEEPSSGEHLALKLLVETGDAIARFNREYEALTRLNHPGIVRVYNYGLYQRLPWFSMELLEGKSLQSWIKSCGRPGQTERTSEVIRVGYYLSVALAYIHRRGLIHRDLKSANVMVMPDGRVKLLDFGTAHLKDPVEPITKDGEFIGTFAYASPEQFRGVEVDHRADLYSLGVLLYRLSTGRRPFKGSDPATLARMHTRETPVHPMEHVPSLPDGLGDLIMQLLEKNPDARPQKASAVVRGLVEIAGRPLTLSGFGLTLRGDRLVGREGERKTIETILDGTPGRSIVVSGGDGSGLVGFVNVVAGDAREREMRVFTCTLDPSDPLAPLLELLIEIARDLGDTEDPHLKAAVSGIKKVLIKNMVMRWQRRELLYVAATTMFSRCIGAEPESTLMIVHHQHLANAMVMELMVRLARTAKSEGIPCQFVFTANSSRGSHHTASQQRFHGFLRMQLKPLTVRQVSLMIGALLSRRPTPARLARQVHRISGGEPVWVEQVVHSLVDEGSIRPLGAEGNHLEWDDDGVREAQIPTTAASDIKREYVVLSAYSRRLLQALAVCGSEAPVSVICHAMNWDEPSVQPLIDELVGAGWLSWDEELRTVSWLRELDAHVVRNYTNRFRRRIFVHALAQISETLPSTPTFVDVFVVSGHYHRALVMALACAEESMAAQTVLRALAVLEQVVAVMDGRITLDRELLERMYLMHASCLMRIRPMDPQLNRSLNHARNLASSQASLAHIELLQARLHRQLGHFPSFQKYVVRAWEHAGSTNDSRLKSQIAAYQMQAFVGQGQMAKAEKWLQVVSEESVAIQDDTSLAYAGVMTGYFRLVRGAVSEAEDLLAQAMASFERQGNRSGLWLAMPMWAESLRFQGRFSEALALLYRELPEARESHVPLHYLQLLLAISRAETDLCRLGKAQECVDELEVNIRRGEQLSLRLETMLVKGRIQIMSGQHRKSLATLQEVYERAKTSELPAVSEYARAMLAEALWDIRSREEASGLFESACLGLIATGNQAMLALAVISRAHAMGGHMEHGEIFQPVQRMLDTEPVAILKVEHLIAGARWNRRHKQRKQSRTMFREAAASLNRVAEKLNDTDRAALRVHPWSVHIHRGIR